MILAASGNSLCPHHFEWREVMPLRSIVAYELRLSLHSHISRTQQLTSQCQPSTLLLHCTTDVWQLSLVSRGATQLASGRE